jgi:methionyl-tRNA synthetase
MVARCELTITPRERGNEILELISKGLEDVSFSRPAEKINGWGIPVPGDEEHIVYVWADALTNYLSGVDYFTDREKARFWPADIHVIGKDILRFHAAIWPGMLLSAGIPLPHEIFVHGMITSGGYKMSKTRGNVVNPFKYREKYGLEALRYFLAAAIPTVEDGDFTHEEFVRRYNGDLAKGLGNVTARILTLADGSDFSSVEKRPSEIGEAERFKETWQRYGRAFEKRDLREAIGEVWELIHWADSYIEEKKPWESKDVYVLYTLCVALANISWMLRPFLPETAEKIAEGLGIAGKESWNFAPHKVEALFPKLEE